MGGHTPGQAIVTAATAAGPVILASNAVHCYEELERDRPFARELAAEAGRHGVTLVDAPVSGGVAGAVSGRPPAG